MSALGWWLAGLITWPLLLCTWALVGVALGQWKVTTTRTINGRTHVKEHVGRRYRSNNPEEPTDD